ncbi:hypothetical protein Poli38472_003987 [Pythium oligandrum]|uniref:RING-type E3 ubiquitin transferase n=1 Tax=Pythium oligandrum TaxID=41045 RepID=A0A8K1CPG6_PYTOL|nr:hypothetical protein Poli38472_003987 [Pythium oligandrum]|eukprot:TMW66222.1 hypothetical protein Poli38472_003987 [Pythium oligandrum]
MVFVSLEGFLAVDGMTTVDANATCVVSGKTQTTHKAPLHVVITPGSRTLSLPSSTSTASSSGQKRSRLRRAASSFASLSTVTRGSHASPPVGTTASSPGTASAAHQFVLYVTDHDVHHKWVLAKTQDEHTQLQKMIASTTVACERKHACCASLRRIVESTQYKQPKRRWSESRVQTQVARCQMMQEYLNDLIGAVRGQEQECASTTQAWELLDAFLGVQTQRDEVADSILLATMAETPRPRRFSHRPSINLEPEQPTTVLEEEDDHQATECPICCTDFEDEVTSELPCGHTYHVDCVRVWLRMQHTCPVCRIPIVHTNTMP